MWFFELIAELVFVPMAEAIAESFRGATMKKKLSIGSWAYLFNQEKPTHDFHEILHKLSHLGYEGIELGTFGAHPTPVSHPTRASRLTLKKEVVDHGLEFSGMAADLWSFKKPGPSILDENPTPYVSAFLGFAAFGADLGIKTIRVDTVEPPDFFQTSTIDPKVGLDRLINVWDKCSKIAADYGMNVAFEFEPAFAFNKPSEVLHIIEGVRAKGNSNFGVLYDTCHAHLCAAVGANQPGAKETLAGGAMELLHKLKGKITHVHLIDSDGSLNEHQTSKHKPFGTGVLDFDKLLPAINDAGVPNDWWCVDLCFLPNAWDVTADCKQFLDKMRGKYSA
jgi:sugar phosphate isomerase/epimerase